MTILDPRDFIDLARYPLDATGSERLRTLTTEVRAGLAEDGCAVLRGVILPERIGQLVEEADGVASKGHRSFSRTNAYFTKDDPRLPGGHPVRRFYDRSNAFVPADNFGAGSTLRALYEWPSFPAFIQAALGEPNFYRYADPLADVIVNVTEAGDGFPWHFDTNNYTVTLAIQNGVEGGEFEYCANLRSAIDENYAGVERILDGDGGAVKTLELRPGDLQIFKGRYALHRVKPVAGQRRRYVGIFSFVEEPGMVGSPERTRQLYGRVLPIHLERAGQRADALID